MTDAPRTASVPLDFLENGVTYEADVYRDGDSKTALVKEKKDGDAQRRPHPARCSRQEGSPSTCICLSRRHRLRHPAGRSRLRMGPVLDASGPGGASSVG